MPVKDGAATPGDIVVEPATGADLTAMAALHAACFPQPWSAESIGRLLSAGATGQVLWQDGRLAGFILCRLAGDECEVLSCAVDPRDRGAGCGRALLGAALADAARDGAVRAVLEVDETNSAARALYGRCGFRTVGRRKHYYRGPAGDPGHALIMARDLPA